MQIQQIQLRMVTRVGTTPAVAVHLASRGLARPIQRSITRQSPIQVVSQKCLQPPHLAPPHSAPQNQENYTLSATVALRDTLLRWQPLGGLPRGIFDHDQLQG